MLASSWLSAGLRPARKDTFVSLLNAYKILIELAEESEQMTALYFLWHPQTESTFSAYGVQTEPGTLKGLLMVDRPQPVSLDWLAEIQATFGEFTLHVMTATGERGIACVMQIEPGSQKYVKQLDLGIAGLLADICTSLKPAPRFLMRWDNSLRLWKSEILTDDTQ